MKNLSKNIFIRLSIVFALTVTLGQSRSHAETNLPPALEKIDLPSDYYRPFVIDPEIYDSPYRIGLFKPQYGEDGARAWSQTKSIFFYGLGAVAVLMALPEESTGWEKDFDIFNKWIDNVKEGPEWDRNKWVYNYVGHTYFGGVYYQVARKSGYRQWDSFMYTFMMSTFYWEYGVEAFAEVPSIQDIIFTPIAGWIYGEWAYQTEMGIRAKDGKVLGSSFLGGTSLFLLDPIDSTGRAVNFLARRKLIKAGYGYFSYNPSLTPDGETDHQVYLNMRIPLGVSGPSEQNKITVINHQDDPVDTGIIGLSLSTGHTVLDDHWNVKDDMYTKVSLGPLFYTSGFHTLFLRPRGCGKTKRWRTDLIRKL